MTKHTIEIKCLPEGWEPVAYRVPKYDEKYLAVDGLVETCECCMHVPHLILQKTKPREVKLVEVEQGSHTIAFLDDKNMWTYWRIKEE